jgi:hypothetical protein
MMKKLILDLALITAVGLKLLALSKAGKILLRQFTYSVYSAFNYLHDYLSAGIKKISLLGI